MWNERLAALVPEYATAILSVVGADGYPVSLRCAVRLDAARQVAVMADPPALASAWSGQACLLFHRFDARLEGLRQLVILGELAREGEPGEPGELLLRVSKFVTANGRQDTDQLPHASSPLRMAQFFWLGWRNTRAYLAKRGAPWPPIPFAAIARKLRQEPP